MGPYSWEIPEKPAKIQYPGSLPGTLTLSLRGSNLKASADIQVQRGLDLRSEVGMRKSKTRLNTHARVLKLVDRLV